MSAEEILITHQGYTDTAYASCGDYGCTLAILRAVGVPEKETASPDDVSDLEIGDDTQVTCGILGEGTSDEWCAACGGFIQHGLDCECEDTETDREPQDGPHVDLRDHPAIRDFRS